MQWKSSLRWPLNQTPGLDLQIHWFSKHFWRHKCCLQHSRDTENHEGVAQVLGSDLQHSKTSVLVNQQCPLWWKYCSPTLLTLEEESMQCSSAKPADPLIPAQAIATDSNFSGSSTLNELQKTQLYFNSPQGWNHTKQHSNRTLVMEDVFPPFWTASRWAAEVFSHQFT